MTLMVLPPSFSAASFSIFARLTLKKVYIGEHDDVLLQEDMELATWFCQKIWCQLKMVLDDISLQDEMELGACLE